MQTRHAPPAQQRSIRVCIGQSGIPVGKLAYMQQGQRAHSSFRYEESWLANEARFAVSPDLPFNLDYQLRKAGGGADSVFHFALADTAPDAWGRRVIARDHAKRRANHKEDLPSFLTELDYLLAVDDFSRVGALRLQDDAGHFLRSTREHERRAPPLIELAHLYSSSLAVERGTETATDLAYLQGRGTSLGGMRPKCTVIDEDGQLAIGKFPSIQDARSVTRGEVLAMQLAKLAGIEVAPARIVDVGGTAVAVVKRFDRIGDARIPYMSAASLLQMSREHDGSYTEIADGIRAMGSQPQEDLAQLWRRMVFNFLICNVDDHLQNHGFLHTHHGQWRLAPAFDLNPFPDKLRESKTWLSPVEGPITSLAQLKAHAGYFGLQASQADIILHEVQTALAQWRKVALSQSVGLRKIELEDFAAAFDIKTT